MANSHGSFIWYELLATDPDAAQRFYADVVGWTIEDSGMDGMDYRFLLAPDTERIGGLMAIPDGMPGGPVWLGYVGVDDVDESVKAIEAVGGAVHMPATDIPGVGRIALVADAHGATFYVMRGTSDEPSTSFVQGNNASPGHAVWNELTTSDPDAAIDFYTRAFGWRQEGSISMGDDDEYRFIHAGSDCLGGVQGRRPECRDGWQSYFMVADLDAAVERLEKAGGKVVQGPDDIPGGGFSLIAEDPQGARFGLVG